MVHLSTMSVLTLAASAVLGLGVIGCDHHAKRAGNDLDDAAKQAGDQIKDTADDVGDAVGDAVD